MWGKAFPAFDAKHAYSVQYQVSQNIDFDLCIDDVFLGAAEWTVHRTCTHFGFARASP